MGRLVEMPAEVVLKVDGRDQRVRVMRYGIEGQPNPTFLDAPPPMDESAEGLRRCEAALREATVATSGFVGGLAGVGRLRPEDLAAAAALAARLRRDRGL